MEDIKQKIINILDESYRHNSIITSFSIIDPNFFLLHIYNPKKENIVINNNNKSFYEKITKMLFDNKNKEYGCFNHQHSDDSILYNSPLDIVLNIFLKIEYSFILIKTNSFTPVSISCFNNNYIYNVCTDFNNRNKGNMGKLLNHFFKLVQKDKLKNGKHKNILLDIVYVNPDYKNIQKFYENNYNFKFLDKNPDKIILQKKINQK